MKTKLVFFLSVSLSVSFLAACAHKQVKQDTSATAGAASSQPAAAMATGGPAASADGSCSDDIQCP